MEMLDTVKTTGTKFSWLKKLIGVGLSRGAAFVVFLLMIVPLMAILENNYFPYHWYLPIQLDTLLRLAALTGALIIETALIRQAVIWLRNRGGKPAILMEWLIRTRIDIYIYCWLAALSLSLIATDLAKLSQTLLPTLHFSTTWVDWGAVGLGFLLVLFPPRRFNEGIRSGHRQLDGRLRHSVWVRIQPLVTKVTQKIALWWQGFAPLPPGRKLWALKWVWLILLLTWLLQRYGNTLVPPQIVATFPNRQGEGVWLDSAIEIQFDKPMRPHLFDQALTISPPVPVDIAWDNPTRLIVTPKEPLQRQATYTVRFTKPLLSQTFIPVINPQPITFATIGHPIVSLATPQQEAAEEKVVINVLFDRPMVPLTTQANKEELAPAFTISPAVEGKGRWLGTTAYQFRPLKKLPPATTYTYTVAKGLKSEDGGELQADANFSFSTMRPRVEQVVPANQYDYANPAASVAAILNLPVSKKVSPDAIEVTEAATGQPVSGTVKTVANRIGFYAAGGLKRQTKYQAKLKAGLQSTLGPNGLENDYEWSFTTIPQPAVTGSTPTNGSTGVEEMYSLSLQFVSPMDEKSLSNNLLISPDPGQKPRVYFSSYDGKNSAHITTYLNRSTRYTITLRGSATDIYGTPLGRDYVFNFETGPFKPSLSIVPANTYFAAFNQTIAPRIVTKVTNVGKLNYKLYQLTRDQFMELYKLRHVSGGSVPSELAIWQSYDPGKLKLLKSWSEQFETNQNVPVNVITVVEPQAGAVYPPGFYFLDISLDNGTHDNMVMIVSKATLSFKQAKKDQYLVWSVNQTEATPVAGMQLELMTEAGTKLASGTTNQDGVWLLNQDLHLSDDYYRQRLLVFGQKDDDVVMVAEQWNQGIEPYQFGLATYYDPQENDSYRADKDYKIHLTLDRPIYRPGQKVNFKGVIREDTGKALVMPNGRQTVEVQITDAEQRLVETKTLNLTSYGSFSDSISLSEEAAVGNYALKAAFEGNSFRQTFQVEEYVPAAFETTVSTDRDKYIAGETTQLKIAGNYYFGAPVSNAAVSWSVSANDSFYQWYKDVSFEFGTYDYYDYRPWWSYGSSRYASGQLMTQGEGKLNDQGELKTTLPVNLGKAKTDQVWRFEAVVKNKESEAIAGTKEITLTTAGIRVGIKPTHYSFKTGEAAGVEVVTLDLSDKEVPTIPVTISYYKRDWTTAKEYDEDSGDYYWTSKPTDRLIGETIGVTTNESGRANANMVLTEGGNYRIVAQAADTAGRITTSATYVWISGHDAYPRYQNNDRVLLIPDKADYTVGETAEIQAVVPYEKMIGLVTTERDSIYRYQVVNLSGDQKTFTLGLGEEDSPNMFVSGLFIKGGTAVKDPPQQQMGATEIRVKNPKKQLHISIQPDKAKYQPGETANLQFAVVNGANEPVKTELAVAVVDQSVWALSGVKLADIFETFYRPRNHAVRTSSLLSVSMDRINATTGLGSKGGSGGGGGGGEAATNRNNFQDTAYWQAHLETDAGGKASAKVKLADNTTTWRIIAQGVTQDAAVGQTVSKVIATKDVLIRPLLPRFVSVGDVPRLGFALHNRSEAEITIEASMLAENFSFNGGHTQTIKVPALTEKNVFWSGTVTGIGEMKMSFTVKQNGTTLDGLTKTIPIHTYYTKEVVATAGHTANQNQEQVEKPADIVPDLGQLEFTISPVMGLAPLNDAVNYFKDYTYWCVEQTSSRIVTYAPLMQLEKAAAGIFASQSVETMDATIKDALQRLVAAQKVGGGWSGWADDAYPPNIFSSSMAMEALARAKEAGYQVDKQAINNGLQFLKNNLVQKTTSMADQVMLARVISLFEPVNQGILSNLFVKRWELDAMSRVDLLTAMDLSHSDSASRTRLYQELLSLAKKTNTTTHFEERSRRYQSSANHALTAGITEAMTRRNPNQDMITEIMRYFDFSRKAGYWRSTRETALVAHAMAQVIMARGDLQGEFDWQVLLNQSQVSSGKLEPKTGKQKIDQISLAKLQPGANTLGFRKSGSGTLYYNLNYTYYLPFSQVPAREQGIVVVRELVDSNGEEIVSAQVLQGREYWVRLTVAAPYQVNNVIVEDMLPAGFEPVNESLATTVMTDVKQPEINTDQPEAVETAEYEGDKTRQLYVSHQEMRDDRVVLFVNTLHPGVYEYIYRVHASIPGKFHYPPASASNMYIPEINGHSSGDWLTIAE